MATNIFFGIKRARENAIEYKKDLKTLFFKMNVISLKNIIGNHEKITVKSK